MSYLLGFPSPVIEVIVVMVAFVLGCALLFGYRFETVDVQERRTDVEPDVAEPGETSE